MKAFTTTLPNPTPRDLQLVKELAQDFDEDTVKQSADVKHFLGDLHGEELLRKALYTTTLNIQGINGGYTGPAFKTVLPHSVKVKLESRIIADQTRSETAAKVRRHLDNHGYSDIRIVDQASEKSDDWSRVSPDAGIVGVMRETYQNHGFKPLIWPFSLGTNPQYIWTKHLKIPYLAGGLGYGARAHAPDEFYVIEGDGEKHKVAGLVEAEKFFIDLLYQMAGRRLN